MRQSAALCAILAALRSPRSSRTRRIRDGGRLAAPLALALALTACGAEDPADDALPALRLPTGAALSPGGERLFVVNSDLDLRGPSASLIALDLARLDEALADLDARDGICRPSAESSEVADCDVQPLIAGAPQLRLPTGAGNIAVDRPLGEGGPLRLLIPSARSRVITWIDAQIAADGALDLDCGQDAVGACDQDHTLERRYDATTRLPVDAARLVVDGEFRYAYLPHLTGGAMTLIDLDGERGPEIVDIKFDLFRSDPLSETTTYAGGFGVAARPCRPDDAPALTRGCTRPLLYASHRFWPGLRRFTVAVGVDVLQVLDDLALLGVNPQVVEDRPYIGDLRFEDPAGDHLLVVHTTPPALTRVDTRVGEDGDARDAVLATVPLCNNPNLLALYDNGPSGERLAFVSCYGDDQIAVISRGAFLKIATIPVGGGPNELIVDAARQRLYVVETLNSAISLIELDPSSPRRLQVIARIAAR
jgi:DNA-binding beta-propeller fold protein YncE